MASERTPKAARQGLLDPVFMGFVAGAMTPFERHAGRGPRSGIRTRHRCIPCIPLASRAAAIAIGRRRPALEVSTAFHTLTPVRGTLGATPPGSMRLEFRGKRNRRRREWGKRSRDSRLDARKNTIRASRPPVSANAAPRLDHPIMHALKAKGITGGVMMPQTISDGAAHGVARSTGRAGFRRYWRAARRSGCRGRRPVECRAVRRAGSRATKSACRAALRAALRRRRES